MGAIQQTSLCVGADPLYFSIIPGHFGNKFCLKRKLIRTDIEEAVNAAKIPTLKSGNIVFVHKESFCSWAIQRNSVSDSSKDFFIRSINSQK